MLELDFKKMDGLVPAIVQDYKTNKVLMLGFMNKEAWQKTLETGKVHYFSRTRNKLWLKGETSGNFQIVKDIFIDCDNDTVLIKADQVGKVACHEGYETCFFKKIDGREVKIVEKVLIDPKKLYGGKK